MVEFGSGLIYIFPVSVRWVDRLIETITNSGQLKLELGMSLVIYMPKQKMVFTLKPIRTTLNKL